jgi:hypothetical protein
VAKTATTVISYTISGDNFSGTAPLFSQSIANSSAVVPTSIATSNGATTVTVPAAAVGAILIPPPGSSVTKVIKGVTGDTGVAIDPANPTVLKWSAGQIANFVLTCNGVETVEILWM